MKNITKSKSTTKIEIKKKNNNKTPNKSINLKNNEKSNNNTINKNKKRVASVSHNFLTNNIFII